MYMYYYTRLLCVLLANEQIRIIKTFFNKMKENVKTEKAQEQDWDGTLAARLK